MGEGVGTQKSVGKSMSTQYGVEKNRGYTDVGDIMSTQKDVGKKHSSTDK